jgi:peptidoglycan hydrolase CwlO-like protein
MIKIVALNELPMMSDELGRQLHDRSTRGEVLSTLEEQQLDAWYDSQDQRESELLLSSSVPTSNLSELQTQIEKSLNQLEAVVDRIQKVSAENTVLQREVAELRQQLAF